METPAQVRVEWHEKPDFPISIHHNRGFGADVLGIHCHGDFEILHISSGTGLFRIGDDICPAESGDILFVNPYEFHAASSEPGQYVEYDAIVYERHLLESITLHPDYNRFIRPLLENRIRFPHRLPPDSPLSDRIHGLIGEILTEYRERPSGHEWIIRTNLENLVVLLSRLVPVDTSPGKDAAKQRLGRDFAKLFSCIADDPARRISTKDAANLVKMSPWHFCRRFKEFSGRTFVDFFNDYRVNEAERLLREKEWTVSEIAERVGFCNIHYFDRVFRRYKGCTPSQMRRQTTASAPVNAAAPSG